MVREAALIGAFRRSPHGLVLCACGFCLPQALKEMVGNIALFGTYDATLAALSGTTAKALQASGGHLLQGQSWLAIWPAGSLAGMAYYMVCFPTLRPYTDTLLRLWPLISVRSPFIASLRAE